jgi:adenylate cyclase
MIEDSDSPSPSESDPRAASSLLFPREAAGQELSPESRAKVRKRVRKYLLKAGATDEEIDQAIADDTIDLLTVDRILVPAPRRYTREEVADITGVDGETLHRLWRALGFLDVGEAAEFTDLDIDAIRTFQELMALGVADIDGAMQMARVMGSSLARIADAEVSHGRDDHDQADPLLRAESFARVAGTTVPALAKILEFIWRRHIQAATRRTMLQRGREGTASPSMAVGFADMVGFTLLSQHLDEEELAKVVRRFEEISHDIVTGLGGRVVKMIGDEAMFIVGSAVAAARIGLGLAEAYADDDLLSDVRVGLAYGSVLVRDGDFYGPTVNLAHRIVNIGNPGTVLMDDEFHTALMEEASDEFTAQALRPRTLKDIGRVQLWWAGRSGGEIHGADSAADRRRNLRWERLAIVLRDLEDFREAGERLFSGSRRSDGDGADAPAPEGASVGLSDHSESGDLKGS